jgi:hypothetical protein
MLRPWRVLLLSAGYGNETLRDEAFSTINDLGFEISVYDRPGYPVDPSTHSHAACIEAIDQHDIVVALIDEKEGGTFQVDEIPKAMRTRLAALGVIADRYDSAPLPSILQVEVLTARATGRPVICLVPDSVREICHTVLEQLPNLIGSMTARRPGAVDARALVSSRKWNELHDYYDVPVRGIAFGQVAFLERVRRERPNYLSYFPLGRRQELGDHLVSRLASLPATLVRLNLDRAQRRLRRERAPIAASESLAWLRENGLIVSGPYKSDSPLGASEPPLLSYGRSIALPRHLAEGTSVALLGDPGMGKSTYLLLAIVDVFEELVDPAPNLLFASWRELSRAAQRSNADQLVRTLIGLAAGRSPWPQQLSLPSIKWQIVIDGIDESDVDVASLRALLGDLTELGAVLVSCREYDFERRLYPIQESFERIIRLLPWGKKEIDQYKSALASEGDSATVEYIDSHRDDYRGVLSVPLWLTMITFLGRRGGSVPRSGEVSDYALLSQCGQAVAEDELRRTNPDGEPDAKRLLQAWQMAAWRIYIARRGSGPLREDSLREALEVEDDLVWSACRSLLDELNGSITGFVHEIFLEYWLAEYIVAAMMPQNKRQARLAEALSFQRSVTTNRLVRQGIAYWGITAEAAAGLREAFWQASEDEVFSKNQILYLLGRIDDSSACKRFLLSIWRNKTEPTFVRYSAAYAAVILGVHSVEEEFYAELRENETLDRMNRWYHRYYYGDLYADEKDGPGLDDDTGGADRAMEQLLKRLGRKRSRHRYLRRIELFTLRKFIETRGIRTVAPGLAERLGGIEQEVSLLLDRPQYVAGVHEEIGLIRVMLAS